MGPLALAGIGAGIQAGTGILGYLLSMPDRQKAEDIIRAAADEFGNIDEAALEKLVAQEVGPSAMEGIKTDPRLKSAQFAALDRLEQMGREGLTLEDKAAQNEAMRAAARQESAGRQAIAQDFAARGQLGGGAQLAMQLANQQGAAERASQTSMQTAANAQRRMYDAMLQSGQLAGNLRNQDFGEQERIAQAKDAVQRYNAGARQQAGQAQFNAQQTLANRKLQAAQLKSGVYGNRAQATQGIFGAVGGAANQGFNLGAGYMAQQQNPQQRPPPNPYNDPYGGWRY